MNPVELLELFAPPKTGAGADAFWFPNMFPLDEGALPLDPPNWNELPELVAGAAPPKLNMPPVADGAAAAPLVLALPDAKGLLKLVPVEPPPKLKPKEPPLVAVDVSEPKEMAALLLAAAALAVLEEAAAVLARD